MVNSKNFLLQADNNYDAKMKNNTSKNLLEGDKHSSSLRPNSSAKLKAKFNLFFQGKSEVEAELQELLCSEKDDGMQLATLKLRALDLKARLTSLGVTNWVNSDSVNQIDPMELSNWEDQVSKSVENLLYRSKEKITIRKGLAQIGFAKRNLPKFNGSVLDFPLLKKN